MLATQKTFQNQLVMEMILSLMVLAGCVAVVYWIERRRFYRRGAAGLQRFPSFGLGVWTLGWEGIFRWVARVSGVLALLLAITLGIFIHIGNTLPAAQMADAEWRECVAKNGPSASATKCLRKTAATSARTTPSS
jgi:Na+/melibiose symporter-like transporter